MTPRAAFVSFRFGDTDGVSVVARSWMSAFADAGYDVVTVTGDQAADRTVVGIGIDAAPTTSVEPADVVDRDPDPALVARLDAALADVDLVVVENLLTIPLNLPASRALARVLRGRPALVHHHDPPWHRERFAHIDELPATDPAWRHVSINQALQRELAGRGIESTVIYNGFERPRPLDDTARAELRAKVRADVGLGADDLVVAHPVRAIERKNLPAAIELCERLGATYWLLGPAEEGYGPRLDELLAAARCPVVHRSCHDTAGIYAAADHITFPSTWEGFGNPPIEAALHRRTVSVGDYPVAHELQRFGFRWYTPDDVDAIRAALADPASIVADLDHDQAIALEHFTVERVHAELHSLLDAAGWMP